MTYDDDDWVGTPPEGRYTADRAKPDFWWKQRAPLFAFAALAVLLLALLAVLVL